MNLTRWKWLLAVSLALNAGMLAAVGWHVAEPRLSSATETAKQANLPDYLDLTPEQRQRWNRIEEGFLDDLAGNWQEIRVHREALVRNIFATEPDKAAINKEQARIVSLQDAQQRRVIAQLLAERDLLNDRQRIALRDLLLSRYGQERSQEERLHRH